MRRLLYTLFILVTLVSNLMFSQIMASDTSEAQPTLEQTKNTEKSEAAPRSASSSPDDHGFTFPLEDLVESPEKHNERFYTEFLNMLATLGLVIAVILMAAWFLRRLLNTRLEQINTTSIIKIVERRALSSKTAVYLLEIYDKVIAVAETQSGITQLGEFPIPPEDESTSEVDKDKIPSSFKQILEKKL